MLKPQASYGASGLAEYSDVPYVELVVAVDRDPLVSWETPRALLSLTGVAEFSGLEDAPS